MLAKTIKYTDYNGVDRNETYLFNLSKAEIAEMELSVSGGFAEMCKKIVDAQDAPSLIKIFKELVLKSYGEKSPDGKHFMKLDENGRPLSAKFAQSEAYSVLFMELATDAEAASAFINGIMPSDMVEESNQKVVQVAK